MDDKTMLELAARAAGYDFVSYHIPQKNRECALSTTWGGAWAEVRKPESPLGACRWNPLTDDGDALRLAVKLRLDVELLRGGDFVKVSTYYGDVTAEVEHTGDPLADTRRAIVMAAAEIGKGMGVVE